MAVCLSCNKPVRTGKFCPNCGRLAVDESVKFELPTEGSLNPSNNVRAMWAHLGAAIGFALGFVTFITFFLLWVPGLIVRSLATATDYDRKQAEESINFQLTLLVVNVGGVLLGFATLFIGFLVILPALIVINLAALVLMVMATVAATNGRDYRYPLTIRFVK